MELIKVLLLATVVFAFGCTDTSSKTKDKSAKGSATGPAATKPDGNKKGTPTPTPSPTPADKGSTQTPAPSEAGTDQGAETGDPDDDDVDEPVSSASKSIAKKVTITGLSSEAPADAKTTSAVADLGAGAKSAAQAVVAGKPTDVAADPTAAKDEKAADAAKAASPEQTKAVKTIVATLNAAHLQLLNKTERQFNIAKNAISNSLLKEISTYLARHLDRTGAAEKLVQYAGDCANKETKKRSKIGFRGTGDSLELNLYLASCESKEGVKAANVRLRPSQNAFELHFFNENLSSTSVAWVQLISNEGQCTFYHKPDNFAADALVQMDCGETRGKCGSDAVDKLPSFKGIAVSIPSARPGVTELAMFERIYQYNETHGSEHFPKKFYSCAHRFEQKRTECTSDCLDRKSTTVMILKDDKYHVNPDYLNDAKRAFEKTERARKEQESRDAAEAVQKQAAEAAAAAKAAGTKQKTQAELTAEHQAALKQQGADYDPAAAEDAAKEEPNPEDLTGDGSAQYPKPKVAAPKPASAPAMKPAVKPRSQLTQEELDKLSPEQLEQAEEEERRLEDAKKDQ